MKRCPQCKQELPLTEFVLNKGKYYSWCRKCTNRKTREYYQRDSKKKIEYARQYRKKFGDKVRTTLIANRLKLRMEVLKVYGGVCQCCGESEIKFLAIDHINGGGNKHNIQLKKRGINFYRWLRKNNFPKGFQVLCHNCNMAKGFYGRCPHKS